MRTRFAPSPTGLLHLGHAFSARLCHDLAARLRGEVLLRFEDIDFTRVRDEYYEAIVEDLAWLGMEYKETPWRQLERMDNYQAMLQDLINRELTYPCFCTRKDLAGHAIDAPQGEVTLYNGHCRDMSAEAVQEKMRGGVPYAWRLNAEKAYEETGPLTFIDAREGTVSVDPGVLGDVIIARKDIQTSYHIAVVVDDAAQGITDVVRGEDLLPSTHVHRILQSLWNYPEPSYHHHPLICDENGKRLAKRHKSQAVRELIAKGLSREEVLRRITGKRF